MENMIRFDYDKNGKKVAYKWLHKAIRWCRMSLAEAELREASGEHVYYGPNPWKPGKFEYVKVSEHRTNIVQVS